MRGGPIWCDALPCGVSVCDGRVQRDYLGRRSETRTRNTAVLAESTTGHASDYTAPPMGKFVVRFGSMRRLGVFTANWGDSVLRGTRVISRTDRGLEVGEVLCEATDAAISQIQEPAKGQLLRAMTHDDDREVFRLKALERQEFETCGKHIVASGMPMKLIDVEHIFGGERIIVYYLAENRIDFRDLVKALAGEFQTRIEMRQIGVRDEAKLLADYGDCGKPVCCNTHLSEMPPVSMKMAKLQKSTLDPAKISGRCGRLKCCLRYEYDTYEELQKSLPPVGADVVTNVGRARVLGQEILAGQLLVETEDHRRVLINSDQVLTVLSSRRPPRPPEDLTESLDAGGEGGGAASQESHPSAEDDIHTDDNPTPAQ